MSSNATLDTEVGVFRPGSFDDASGARVGYADGLVGVRDAEGRKRAAVDTHGDRIVVGGAGIEVNVVGPEVLVRAHSGNGILLCQRQLTPRTGVAAEVRNPR